jgi:hypothetical protein
METNKDLILRNTKYFSDFLIALIKENPIEKKTLILYIIEIVI